MRKIWLNRQLLPESEAKVSVYDSAMMFGDTVFEMFRSFNKRHFKLYEHMDRLVRSAKYLEIPLDFTPLELCRHYESMVESNRDEFGADDEIRGLVNITRGILPLYEPILPLGTNVMMTCFPLRWIIKGAYRWYQRGVPAVIPRQMAVPARFLEPKVKNRSRIHYRMADLQAKKVDPDAWAILLDDNGFVAEGSGSNFFIVKDRRLYTPQPRNILRGISRDYVIKLAQNLKIDVFERNIEPYDVYNADEAFFTCTPYSIMPCTNVDGHLIGTGAPGRYTKRLIHKWSEEVRCSFIDQSRRWDGA